jgi:hypothetical protein
MNIPSRVMVVLTGAALGVSVQAAQAQAVIKSITANRTQAELADGKAAIKFAVDGEAAADSNCGVIIEYSGIDTPDNRKVNSKDGLWPKVVEHVFTQPGAYDVKAKGGRVGGTLGCSGQAMVQVVVTAPPAAAAMPRHSSGMRSSACYQGWRFSQKQADKSSGAFTCKPKRSDMQAPQQRIECPAGLVYFEKGATYGCSL